MGMGGVTAVPRPPWRTEPEVMTNGALAGVHVSYAQGCSVCASKPRCFDVLKVLFRP